MNYAKHYNAIIDRARYRELSGYSEWHHILPKCLGGTEVEGNLVRLTAEEHFVAHLLLVKMHPGHRGLIWAAMVMTGKNRQMKRSNKLYGWLKRTCAEASRTAQKGKRPKSYEKLLEACRTKPRKPCSGKTKARISAANTGKVRSLEARKNISAAFTGRVCSEETRMKRNATIRKTKAAQLAGKLRGTLKRGKRWRATARMNGKTYFLGSFETQDAAAVAYDDFVWGALGTDAVLNFPDRKAIMASREKPEKVAAE